MTPPFSLSVLALTRLFISDVSCVSLTSQSSLVRSETGQKAEEVLSNGHMKSRPASRPEQHIEGYDRFEDSDEEGFERVCDIDFPMGVEGTCSCKDRKNHAIIDKREECRQAAVEAGITATEHLLNQSRFLIMDDLFENRPQGCFKYPCKDDPTGFCYFFNPTGTVPAKCSGTKKADGTVPEVKGTPVCKRARYLNGTENQNGGCPKGYGTIMDRDNCTNAAECLGYCDGYPVIISTENASQLDDYPIGCFINSKPGADGCVYYNPPLENWKPPRNPKGTPICNVTIQTWWSVPKAGGDGGGDGADGAKADAGGDGGGDGDGGAKADAAGDGAGDGDGGAKADAAGDGGGDGADGAKADAAGDGGGDGDGGAKADAAGDAAGDGAGATLF